MYPTEQAEIETALLAPSTLLVDRLTSEQQWPRPVDQLPVFLRNIEETLNKRRSTESMYTILKNFRLSNNAVDFCSGDILSLNASGALRTRFLAELAKNPGFTPGSGGVRLMDGNYPYLEQAERDIAAFHGAEDCLIVSSAYEANVAIWSALPRPGDVLVYDTLVHASTHEGMKRSYKTSKVMFQHNNVQSFRSTLSKVFKEHLLVREGKRSVLVAVESIYSMDGDVCPLKELISVAKEFSRDKGNVQFVVDEAHSIGVIGPKGSGLVCQLGVQKDVAIVVHSYGKAMGATGATVLCSPIVRTALVNFGKSIIYTTSPSLPFVATINSGYALLQTQQLRNAQERIQNHARTFFETLTSHPLWPRVKETGLFRVPLAQGWRDRPFLTHIATVIPHEKHQYWLYVHLIAASFSVFSIPYPVVPLGQGRIRIIFHANDTEDQIMGLVNAVFTWAAEIFSMNDTGMEETETRVARKVNEWKQREQIRARL
ncbi:hypothetical protein TWF694_002195 [Orbilia ellipsospora]|uniref:Aminotransferase class I/classII large domain-containing protein n=1 Tax=Orbilia ellipsospora TaxID=2528407 RepID=A0AAV9X632_9PEZI